MGSSEERVVAVIMVGGPTKGMAMFRVFDGNDESHFSASLYLLLLFLIIGLVCMGILVYD